MLRMWLRGQRSLAGHPSGKVSVAGGREQCPEICLPVPTSMPSQPPSHLSLLSPQSCNTSCPSGFHGNNCSVPCECPEGNCDPVSGACQLGKLKQRVQGEVAGGRMAFFFFLAVLRDMWDLSSLTRDRTRAPYSGSLES